MKKISAFEQILDLAKQKVNPTIDQLNIWANRIGMNYPLQNFQTIALRDADAYVRATEARRSLRSGDFNDSPRNDNSVYRGLISPTSASQKKTVRPSPTFFPTATPTRIPTRLPTATRTPIPSTTPAPQVPGRTFDFSEYTISKPGFEGKTIPQPPQDIANIIWEIFGSRNEATPAAAVAWSENGLYNPNAVGAPNDDYNQSRDYGIFQVNSNTFNDLWQRRPVEMKQIGAYTLEDLKNPLKNAQVSELIRKDEKWAGSIPWGRWFGWQPPPRGKGINLQEMIRKLSESKKKKKR